MVPRGRQPQGRGVDDENLVFEMSLGVEAITSFDPMGICDNVLRWIHVYDFEKPSAIQQQVPNCANSYPGAGTSSSGPCAIADDALV